MSMEAEAVQSGTNPAEWKVETFDNDGTPLPLPVSFAGHELEAMAIMLRVLDAILTVASDKAKEVEGSTPKPCN